MATIDEILAAVSGGGGRGQRFFESPATAAEAADITRVAQQRQQQREQLDFLTGILEAKSAAEIRTKQETDPAARLVELLRTTQPDVTFGRATRGGLEGPAIEIPGLLETISGAGGLQALAPTTGARSEIDLLVKALAKGTTAVPPDRLTAALGEMDKIRKSLEPLTVEFLALKPGDKRRKEIMQQAELLFRQSQSLAGGLDALQKGFGSTFVMAPLQRNFAALGLVDITPRKGGPAPGPQPSPAPTRRKLTPEQRAAGVSPTGTAEGDLMLLLQALFDIIKQSQFPVSP